MHAIYIGGYSQLAPAHFSPYEGKSGNSSTRFVCKCAGMMAHCSFVIKRMTSQKVHSNGRFNRTDETNHVEKEIRATCAQLKILFSANKRSFEKLFKREITFRLPSYA